MSELLAADLFCGAGGTSEGLRRAAKALGLALSLTAVNHWPLAVSTHALNHPDAVHLCANLEDINPRTVVPGGRLDLLVASPECTHHSNARGGKPMNDQSRASAFCVLRWAEALDVTAILIENVPEFASWGPTKDGRPIKSKKGELFHLFVRTLRTLGYKVDWKVLCAADYGDPTTRRRLFLIARKGSRSLPWPKPTHIDPKLIRPTGLLSEADLNPDGRRPWRGAREIIDFSLPSRSVFLREKKLAATTLARIYAGFEKFGGPNAGPFLVALRRHMDGLSLDEPIPTICASGGHFALVEPTVVNMKGRSEARPVDDPTFTQTTNPHQYVAEPFVLPHLGVTGNNQPYDLDDPLQTVTASHGAGKIVEPVAILPHRKFGRMDADGVDDPLRTIDATNGRHFQLVDGVIAPFFGESAAQGPRSHSLDEPLPTVTSHGAGALAEPFLIDVTHASADQAHRVHDIDKPLGTITTAHRGEKALTEGMVVNVANSKTTGRGANVWETEEPLRTITGNSGLALAEAFVVDVAHGTAPGDSEARRSQSIDAPLATVTTVKGKAVVEPSVVQYNRGCDASSVDAPLNTATTKARFALAEGYQIDPETGLIPGLPTFVTAKGVFQIDVRLRMLRPPELAAAHSMDGYEFLGNLEEQVRQIGNGVPASLAEQLCTAILIDIMRPSRARKTHV